MLHLFVTPKSFEGRGDDPFNGTSLSELPLLLILIAVGALALILCLALVMFFAGELVEPLDRSRFPIPACFGVLVLGLPRETKVPIPPPSPPSSIGPLDAK